jgi:hypothetical protein
VQVEGETCGSVGPVQDCETLAEYIRKKHPRARVGDDDPVAYVSFHWLAHPVPVPAAMLRGPGSS